MVTVEVVEQALMVVSQASNTYVPAARASRLYWTLFTPDASTLEGVQPAPEQYSMATLSPVIVVAPVAMSFAPALMKLPAEKEIEAGEVMVTSWLAEHMLSVVSQASNW